MRSSFHIFRGLAANRLWQLFSGKKNRNLWFLSLIVFLGFLAAVLEGGSFAILFSGFSEVQSGNVPYKGLVTKFIPTSQSGINFFYFCFVCSICFQILRSLICYVSTMFATKFSLRIQKEIQSEVYNQILKLTYGYISRMKVGSLLESARSPAHFVCQLLECFNKLTVGLLTALSVVCMMFFLDVRLTIFTLILFVFFGYLQRTIIKKIFRSSDAFSGILAEINQQTSQMLQGIKLIQIYFQNELIKKKIEERLDQVGEVTYKMYFFSGIIPYVNEIISVLVLGMILAFSKFFLQNDAASFPILMTFLMLSYRLGTRLQNVGMIVGNASLFYGHVLQANEILKKEEKEFIFEKGSHFSDPVEEIQFKEVSFSYSTGNREVLRKISFDLRRGDTIGIVGLSGSGKTSLIDLLLRIYEPIKGTICANGTEISGISLKSWRKKFGVVNQDTFLFDDSIEENIRFGLNQASKSQVIGAAKLAGIDKMVSGLPNGYSTLVGERGLRLSGGERQRIALARALLRDPEILILDEATSNLDSHSESCIQEALQQIRGKKTVILIAHRFSTIVHSDLILVVENGSILERGRHEELLLNQGKYFHLWNLQTNQENYEKSFSNR